MTKIFDTYRPDGFGTVNSYVFSNNPNELINFLKNVFFAKEIDRTINTENNEIVNAILKIGTSCIMIAQAKEQFSNMCSAFYLYVNNVDEVHQRAIEHNAKMVFEPADMDYNDRQSGIIDPSGNYWWISMRLEEKGYHE